MTIVTPTPPDTAAAGAAGGATLQLGGAGSRARLVAAMLGGYALHAEFADVTGRLVLDEFGAPESVAVRIGAGSVTSGDVRRDRHLRSATFLDVDRHPHVCFWSRRLEPAGANRWRVHGDLHIRDVARPVVLDVAYDGDDCHATVRVRGQVDRRDFGLVLNRTMERAFGVGTDLTLQAEVPAVGRGDDPVASPCPAPAPAAVAPPALAA